jgi:AraC-like DNA-binding protein
MIQEKEVTSIFRSPYQLFFENGEMNPDGDLLAAGLGSPAERNSWHDIRLPWSRPYYGVSMMLGEGRGSYYNERGVACELTSGHFFLTFPGIKQHYAPAVGERWGEFYISFAGAIFDAAKRQGVISPDQAVWNLENPHPWIEKLQAFAQKAVPATPREKFVRAVHFLEMLSLMLEEANPVQSSLPNQDWFGRTCNMLTKDLHHKANLQQIAGELGMSYHTLRIYFKRRAGMSLIQYRDQFRIKRACEYLAQIPDKPCNEIAFNMGYPSEEDFSVQFKKQMRMTPRQYRKKHARK